MALMPNEKLAFIGTYLLMIQMCDLRQVLKQVEVCYLSIANLMGSWTTPSIHKDQGSRNHIEIGFSVCLPEDLVLLQKCLMSYLKV